VPTIYPSGWFELVGTLRFAHPALFYGYGDIEIKRGPECL